MMPIRTALKALAGVGLGLGFMEVYWETHHFCLTEYEISSEKLKGLPGDKKILFLTDLHNHEYGRHNEELLSAIKAVEPDLILIGGDMIVSYHKRASARITEFLKELPLICPVYYANGNHEQLAKEDPLAYSFVYEEFKQQLEEAGVDFLENSSEVIEWGDARVRLTGLEIPSGCYTHLTRKRLYLSQIWQCIGKPDPDAYNILLAHNPFYIKSYVDWGADLVLAGHLHGGVVGLPHLRGAISPDLRLFPRYCGGLYKEGDTDIVVSRGLGTHTVNLRLFNPAELVCLTLKSGL